MVPPGTRSPCGLLLYLRGSLLLPLLLLSLASLLPPGAQAGKVLVFPVDGSHWVNMKILIQGLHDRGHQVTVVRTASTWYVKEESPLYDSITVALPEPIDIETPDFFVNFLSKMMAIQRAGASPLAFAAFWGEILTGLAGMHHKASQLAVEMFENRELMQRLREAQYDLALIDPGLPAGVLVAHALGLPTVFNVRWITSGEAHFVLAPCPISYVPQASSMLSDTMSFAERMKNAMTYAINAYIDRYVVSPPYELVATKYFGPEVNFYHLLQATDLWLLRADFVFDFPRPTMPNIVYVGGFQCGPAQPLPPDLEAFVEGSGEHGVILMSLGTLVKGLPIDITSEIAAGFARLPQRVIWRYSDLSEPPRNLGNNTLLVKWMPQNDLLGHPKTRAFVAHGGTNGIYEAIYHGVPIVGVPLLFDQPENMLRMQVRGAAKVLDVTQLDRHSFAEAVEEVLHSPSYRENMQRLSRLHRDQPMHPLDSAIFWTEFVMRHKGAAHLRTESYRMPWYAYHSLDVIGFLVVALLGIVGIVVAAVRFLCLRLCCRKAKSKLE